MSELSQNLLGQALRLKWELGYKGEGQAVRTLAENVPGLDAGSYAEAYARAEALDADAWRLADAWHASKGQTFVSADDLSPGHPGFAPEDYHEALSKNLTWARK